MPPRLRVGLTGGIASGKTSVAERFEELGVPVIDADVVSRAVVAPGQPGLVGVVERFGAGILDGDGELDRRKLRTQVFADANLRRELESILHPLIRAEMQRRTDSARGAYVVLAIPLLVESGRDPDRVDRILVVDVEVATQIHRVMSRDSCSLEQARAIIAAQATRQARLDAADDVIVNSRSREDLRAAVDVVHARYLRLAQNLEPGTRN